jgi:hypothetical protein
MEEMTMGERRSVDGLPNFIFGRDKAVEEAYGFTLAGKLLTDIPKHQEVSACDQQLIAEIIRRLGDAARGGSDMTEAGIWRNRVKPPDGLSPPFSDAVLMARVERCLVVGVRVNPDGFLRLDDMMMAEVMGRH